MKIVNVACGIILLSSTLSFAQPSPNVVAIVPLKNPDLFNVIQNSHLFAEKRGKLLLVRVLSVATDKVSRYAVGTDEVDSYLYVSAGEYGEGGSTAGLKQGVFKVGPFFAPKFLSWVTDPTGQTQNLLFTYRTIELKYGSLAITRQNIRFTEGIRKSGRVSINVPDTVLVKPVKKH